MKRLHPHDLRAIVAGSLAADPVTFHGKGWEKDVSKMTDMLLAELERTAKPDPDPESEEGTENVEELKRQIRVRDDHNLRLLDENDDLRREVRGWAEAQDSLRSGWLEVVAALAEIVPEIPGESTLSMVKRIKASVDGLTRKADDGPITLCAPGSWFPKEALDAEVAKERDRIVAMVCTKGHQLLVCVPQFGAPYFDEKRLRAALEAESTQGEAP